MDIEELIDDLDELVVIARNSEDIGVSKWLQLNGSVADVKELLEKQLADKWIPVSERLPRDNDIYLVTFEERGKRYVERLYFSAMNGWYMPLVWQDEGKIEKIIAWRPLPEPYLQQVNEEEFQMVPEEDKYPYDPYYKEE